MLKFHFLFYQFSGSSVNLYTPIYIQAFIVVNIIGYSYSVWSSTVKTCLKSGVNASTWQFSSIRNTRRHIDYIVKFILNSD